MTDHTKHPLLNEIYELCQAIEKCGASPELTKAVIMASDLSKSVKALIDKVPSESEVSGVTLLPDGSAAFTSSFPLPKDHWLYTPGATERDEVRDVSVGIPLPILTHELRHHVQAAARYAIRGATKNGTIEEFDPDALVQNTVYALCGPYSL